MAHCSSVLLAILEVWNVSCLLSLTAFIWRPELGRSSSRAPPVSRDSLLEMDGSGTITCRPVTPFGLINVSCPPGLPLPQQMHAHIYIYIGDSANQCSFAQIAKAAVFLQPPEQALSLEVMCGEGGVSIYDGRYCGDLVKKISACCCQLCSAITSQDPSCTLFLISSACCTWAWFTCCYATCPRASPTPRKYYWAHSSAKKKKSQLSKMQAISLNT